MSLISRVALRLAVALILLMSLWATLFYFAMADEIRDEVDDALEDYTSLIITRKLAGQELPQAGDGSNNTFTITPVSPEYAGSRSHYRYHDESVYIPEKRETEPARVITTIFSDAEGRFYELKVSAPKDTTHRARKRTTKWCRRWPRSSANATVRSSAPSCWD